MYKDHYLSQLRLVVLCEVSGSARQASTFFLQFVHILQAEFTRVRSLMFVSGIVDVTPLFRHRHSPDDLEALQDYPTLNLFGFSHFGHAFYQFYHDELSALNRDTVLLILGNARNNAYDPQE